MVVCFQDDPFKSKDPFGGMSETDAADPFQSNDPFKGGKENKQCRVKCPVSAFVHITILDVVNLSFGSQDSC